MTCGRRGCPNGSPTARRDPSAARSTRSLYVDGKQFDRQLNDFMDAIRPPGAPTSTMRLQDLDQEGVQCQLAFPSIGLLVGEHPRCPSSSRAVARAWNEWALAGDDVSGRSGSSLPAIVPLVDVADAVAEVEWAAEQGFQSIFLPCTMPARAEWGLDLWEPLWAAADAHDMVLAYHIGTGGENVVYRGPGGAVVNYMETTYPGMRVVSHLVARRRARPSSRSQGADRRGRRGLGTRHRRPDGRGLPATRHVRAAQAEPTAQRDRPPAGLCVLPARHQRGADHRGHEATTT